MRNNKKTARNSGSNRCSYKCSHKCICSQMDACAAVGRPASQASCYYLDRADGRAALRTDRQSSTDFSSFNSVRILSNTMDSKVREIC